MLTLQTAFPYQCFRLRHGRLCSRGWQRILCCPVNPKPWCTACISLDHGLELTRNQLQPTLRAGVHLGVSRCMVLLNHDQYSSRPSTSSPALHVMYGAACSSGNRRVCMDASRRAQSKHQPSTRLPPATHVPLALLASK